VPDVGNLHVFGCTAYVHIPAEKRRKLDEKAEKLIFVGYSEESKAFRLLHKDTNTITISRDVIFSDVINKSAPSKPDVHDAVIFAPVKDIGEPNEESVKEEYESAEEGDDAGSTSQDLEDQTQYSMRRQSERINKGVPPDRYVATLKIVTNTEEEPRDRKEAISRLDKNNWKEAMDEEIDSLLKNDTWEIVPAPQDRKPVSCKWVYKIKRNAEGKIERYKARLVARGFSQKYGTDYDEVFAPVVRQTTFRTLLTIAGKESMIVKHYDAKTAFLNGQLKETIYMTQPEGYEIPGKENMVCRLKKSLYGLRQAAKVW
ncbi:hypothetical protein KPH14_013025, partial [Odynerus spinipes]